MNKIIAGMVLIFLFSTCREQQQGITYNANPEFFVQDKSSTGFDFLVLLKNNKVKGFDDKEYKIKVPEIWKGKEIAWGQAYFTGLRHSKTGNEIFFLIINYDTTDTKIVFDKNGNTDFTDDSILNIETGKHFDCYFHNQKDPQGIFIQDFLLRRDVADTSYAGLYRAWTKGQSDYLPSRFIFFDKRKNCRKIILPDNNIITLMDYDCNGFFNDKMDRIMAGDVQLNSRLAQNPVKTKKIRKGSELVFANNTYKLVSVDKYGNSINLVPLNEIRDTTELLPVFIYSDENHRKRTYRPNSSKDYTVLYIWGTWCIGCQYQSSAFNDLMKKKKDMVDYVTLNSGDKEETMVNYIRLKNYPFQYYRINETAARKLNVDAYPSYIVIDKAKRIVLRTSSVNDLYAFLEKKSI